MNKGNLETLNRILDKYKRDPQNLTKIIQDTCLALYLPNILIFHMIGREIGYTEELHKHIEAYERFYKVDSQELIDC